MYFVNNIEWMIYYDGIYYQINNILDNIAMNVKRKFNLWPSLDQNKKCLMTKNPTNFLTITIHSES